MANEAVATGRDPTGGGMDIMGNAAVSRVMGAEGRYFCG